VPYAAATIKIKVRSDFLISEFIKLQNSITLGPNATQQSLCNPLCQGLPNGTKDTTKGYIVREIPPYQTNQNKTSILMDVFF